jgi:hypothetical protein
MPRIGPLPKSEYTSFEFGCWLDALEQVVLRMALNQLPNDWGEQYERAFLIIERLRRYKDLADKAKIAQGEPRNPLPHLPVADPALPFAPSHPCTICRNVGRVKG